MANQLITRLLIPIVLGLILYALVYILHFFSAMELSYAAAIIMIIPSLIIFEITRIAFNKNKPRKYTSIDLWMVIKPFLISLILSEMVVFGSYIPLKLYEINQGARDTISILHIASIGIQILILVVFANAIIQIRFFVQKWHEERTKTLRLEKAQSEAKVKSLQDQLSPHFLFNNLNTLYGLIENENGRIYLKKLSDLYRVLLSNSTSEAITLKDEIQNLTDYLYLLQIRFGELLVVETSFEESQNLLLPPFTLQLLVENAIKHNKFDEDSPLHVSILQEGETIIVANKVSPNPEAIGTQIGLKNLTERYSILTDKEVHITENNHTFKVVVPLLKAPN